MHRDVKIGIAIGVLLIALVAIFMWARTDGDSQLAPLPYEDISRLPPAEEPAPPVGLDPAIDLAEGPVIPATDATGETPSTDVPSDPSTTPGPVAPETPQPKTYTVQTGDNLTKIARAFYGDGNHWRRILDANRDVLKKDTDLRPGMKLKIPARQQSGALVPVTVPAADAPARGRTHTVRPGDSLSRIAKQYYGADTKANIDRIHNANRALMGDDPNRLVVGWQLTIPDAE